MKYLKLIPFLMVGLVGCVDKTQPQSQDGGFRYTFSVRQIENSNLTPAQKAEELAKGAEELLDAKGFQDAVQVSGAALAQDSTNLRAGFIKAVASVLVLQKGLMTRLKFLAEQAPALKEKWEKEVAKEKAKPDDFLNSYYLEDGPSFASEAEFQKHIEATILALDDLRGFLRAHRSGELTMKANPLFLPEMNKRYVYLCKINVTADASYELVCPPSAARHQVNLNRADFELLLDMVTYEELELSAPNSYDLTGSVASLKGFEKIERSNIQQIADAMMASAGFGVLKSPHRMMNARGAVLDIVNSLNWAAENQDSLCPKQADDPQNRAGYYFNKGFCIINGVASFFNSNTMKLDTNTLNLAVQTNGPVPVTYMKHEIIKVAQQDFFAPYERPIPSLKQLGPLKFNNCGKITDLADKTLAGLFPQGDALNFIGDDQPCE